MLLKKLYTEPFHIFDPVKFKNGMNFIYGKKEVINPKNSLNSIGKSTFLDLIDFCLLASSSKTHNPRLFSSKKIINDLTIVLEFEIDQIPYIIKRPMENSNNIEFGQLDDITEYPIKELKIVLGNLIFKQPNYEGVFNSNWFRKLMPFYLKIQKHKKEQFVDPIKYIKEISEEEINMYHFFLMDIDNTILYEIFKCSTDKKKLKPSIKEIKRLVEEKYDLKDLKETQIEINKSKIEIKKLKKAVESFKLGEQYEDAESEANQLTKSIKDNLYHNYIDKNKVESYIESFSLPEKVSIRRVTNIYKEISEDFSFKVNKTLKEAINFRKNLSESRKDFINDEIERINNIVKKRELKIVEFEEKRSKLFYFLKAKEAISDLTEAFFNLSEKQSKLNDLESSTKLLFELTAELSEIEAELNKLHIQISKFLDDIQLKISDFYELIMDVYNSLYIENTDSSKFSLTPNKRKNSLLEIDISTPDMFGKGKNQGRTLVYDLALSISNIRKERNLPRFLIHDGIFDGVDKAHFLSVWEYINSLTNSGFDFQYITTINEEGTLSESFGNKDLVSPDKIEESSILVLTPNSKLFGADFKND